MTEQLKQALATVRQHGIRVTKQRQSLLELLAATPDRYLNITELDDQMRAIYPGVSHNTIYRNLTEFNELGIVEITQRRQGKAVKLKCDDPIHGHHHHFICQRCGRVQEIRLPEIDPADFQDQLPGAQLLGHAYELYGLCATCAQQLTEEQE
ncbi:Fur family transcriptional regulator [Limosilactobacillus equigenerosi]|uniref:Metal uptake regulator n=1 Tax=Limosilactobacillus equigenerosi DSM 18793 = JCM 14505 TaxID=1423742 RepID=A0A0R1UU81_9LACO|nr:Fur family transcriptional regulator [Limosilactobacillus equigenerosi]KRL95027.1 metal uptake regulator [Limosilactobacillus equigenerosi DSM 18793 = JCM 14505]